MCKPTRCPRAQQQVAQMLDIYSIADRIIIWPGPEQHNSTKALSLLQHLSSEREMDWAQDVMKPAPGCNPSRDAPENELDCDSDDSHCIESLLRWRWFQRLWIWQEVYIARENAFLYCRHGIILWSHFCKAIACLHHRKWICTNAKHALSLRGLVQKVFRLVQTATIKSKYRIHYLSTITNFRMCIDPRDRICALMGLLAGDRQSNVFKLDYSKRTAQLYQEAFIYLV